MNGPRAPRWTTASAWLVVAAVALVVLWSPLGNWQGYGTHDWDSTSSQRYLVVKSIRDFGQFPFWDPYGCGGHPAWGGSECGVLVTPLFLGYLAFPIPVALRLELIVTLAVGLFGMWRLSGRFVAHPLLRAFACVVGFENSRWALQAGSGHAWHLYYALLPWFFLAGMRLFRATDRGSLRTRLLGGAPWAFALACLFAFSVYAGAIYPAPHAALGLGVLALVHALQRRSPAALVGLAVSGVWGALLAAPKLLPLMDVMRRFPRHVPSFETIDPGPLWRLFTSPVAERAETPVPGLDYGYHEFGIYIGVAGVVLVVLGVAAAPKQRDLRGLRWAGLFLLACCEGVGPWKLLHRLPVFASQHVPSRFMFPALMLLACVAAAGLGRLIASVRSEKVLPWVSPTLLVALLGVSIPIALEGRSAIDDTFAGTPPEVPERITGFRQVRQVPAELDYAHGDPAESNPRALRELNGPPGLMSRRANMGLLVCMTFGGLDPDAPLGPDGRPVQQGARGEDEEGYRGEAFTTSGSAARIAFWSPNRVEVEVPAAAEGDTVVLNQNWDASWRANDVPAENLRYRVAHTLGSGERRVTFVYVPRTFAAGCALGLLGLGLGGITWWLRRRRQRGRATGSTASPELP